MMPGIEPTTAPSAGAGMKVLHVAAEIYPLVKTGGLADVVAALPPALAEAGVNAGFDFAGYCNQAAFVTSNGLEAQMQAIDALQDELERHRRRQEQHAVHRHTARQRFQRPHRDPRPAAGAREVNRPVRLALPRRGDYTRHVMSLLTIARLILERR